MKTHAKRYCLTITAILTCTLAGGADFRNIATGTEIPSEGYCDQPYVVVNPDGSWLCVMTTGAGREGQQGQHVVACISQDKGQTWSPLIDIEPPDGPEASWVVPLQTPYGRVYALYTYNANNMREVKTVDGKTTKRVDTLGKLMFKYSDDGGRTWSAKRYEVPMRTFEIDRNNVYGGAVQFFWSVSKPIVSKGIAYMGMAKVGNFGSGFMDSSEGVILRSDNVLTERDPAKVVWQTLPDGDIGLRAPTGQVADEHNLVALSGGSLYCTYRTNQGRNCQAYSRDGGHTWTPPAWAEYTPGGKLMKQPRCFNKVYKFSNGKYLLFFHNNGARHYASWPEGNRNPVWLSGGIEKDGFIHWTQPEVFLYDEDYHRGISYPDWIEDGGEYYITETQKETARMHHVDKDFLNLLWGQFDRNELTSKGLILDLGQDECQQGQPFTMPALPRLASGGGFAIEVLVSPYTWTVRGDDALLDTRTKKTEGEGATAKFKGQGILLKWAHNGALEMWLNDSLTQFVWNSGNSTVKPQQSIHAVINVDGQSNVVSFVINGDLCDGGDRSHGFGRMSPYLDNVNGEKDCTMTFQTEGWPHRNNFHRLRIYDRYLTTTEAIGNFRYWQSKGML